MTSSSGRRAGPGPSGDPYAVFRPHRGAVVARVSALATVVVFVLVALLLPVGAGPLDRALIALFGVAVAAFVWRYAQLRAVPTPQGLRVVNLLQRHELEWAQILSVGFSGGAPWVVLELADTEEVAVMAIQRADGERGRQEAARLSALVAHHSGVPPESP